MRSKKTIINESISSEMAEQCMAEYSTAASKLKKIEAEMEIQIVRIREKYQDDIQKLITLMNEKFEVLQTYAQQHPELFQKRKSIEMTHGIIGYRTGTPKLKLLKGMTWAKVTDNLKHYLPEYIRIIEEPAKDRLLADKELPIVQENLPKVGVMVTQDETFYVEPKTEEIVK